MLVSQLPSSKLRCCRFLLHAPSRPSGPSPRVLCSFTCPLQNPYQTGPLSPSSSPSSASTTTSQELTYPMNLRVYHQHPTRSLAAGTPRNLPLYQREQLRRRLRMMAEERCGGEGAAQGWTLGPRRSGGRTRSRCRARPGTCWSGRRTSYAASSTQRPGYWHGTCAGPPTRPGKRCVAPRVASPSCVLGPARLCPLV